MNKKELKHCIEVAMGKKPADILFTNGKIVSTFTEEILETDLAVANGKIVALGEVNKAKKKINLKGAYISPTLIDAHIHIESSMLTPEGFAEAVVPHGTGAVVSDPHEIVNVLGLQGLEYMLKAAKDLPLDIFFGIPSCVPATSMETTGGKIGPEEIRKAFQINPSTPCLSEMMNYPGVYLGIDEVLDKICIAHELGLKIDGHSPLLMRKELNAYMNAGILTDHECMEVAEALSKLRRGMYVLMRQGSAARNLKDLVPILTDKTAHRICIASDDKHPDQLVEQGHLDQTLRELIQLGVDPLRAIRIMSLNPAIVYGLKQLGGLGIGYCANFFIFEDLKKPIAKEVYFKGEKVAENGKLLTPLPRKDAQETLSSVHLPKNLEKLLEKFPKRGMVRAIGVVEGQLITKKLEVKAEEVHKGELAYLAVVERYGKKGQVGLGFIQGLGIQKGALASTVAHDNHNLILVGKSIPDMLKAAQVAEEIGGGFVVVQEKEVKASLPLPVGGLMSLKSAQEVSEQMKQLEKATKELGISLSSPFMVLSFMALSVIPHLKLTDMGLVDVDRFELVPLRIK